MIGGIPEDRLHFTDDATEIRRYGSAKEVGTGEMRRLLASLKRGSIDEVLILFCWIGHSETKAIKRACRRHGIPVRLFGGRGQAQRAVPRKPR